jgi:zinc finger MYND domain-containing protein 10
LRVNARNEREKYENSKWVEIPKSEYSKLPKLEGQVWITIYNLFMDPECRSKYELSDFRKSNLLRVKKYNYNKLK